MRYIFLGLLMSIVASCSSAPAKKATPEKEQASKESEQEDDDDNEDIDYEEADAFNLSPGPNRNSEYHRGS